MTRGEGARPRGWAFLAILGCMLALMVLPSLAQADTGALSYLGCLTGLVATGPTPGGSGACGITVAGSSGVGPYGLQSPNGPSVSSDGNWLYLAASQDDAISRFSLDSSTGAPTFVDCIAGQTEAGPGGANVCSTIPTATSGGGPNSGMDNLVSTAISPDGKSLYTVANSDDSVVWFSRSTTTGALAYQGCITGETTSAGACALVPKASPGGLNSGMDGADQVVISPDGQSVYVAATIGASIVRFDRNTTTGALTYQGCISGSQNLGSTGSQACTTIPKATATSDGDNSGLADPANMAISPSGDSLYVTAAEDAAVSRFDRTAGGALSYQDCVTGETESGPSPGDGACTKIPSATPGATASGLDFAVGVGISPDDRSVYATSPVDSSIAVFGRDTGTGALAYQGCMTASTQVGPNPPGTGACTLLPGATSNGANSGLNESAGMTLSPDNASLYFVAEQDDAIVRFDRNTASGALTYRGCITGESQSATSCVAIPSVASAGTASGLDLPVGLALSPTGGRLYATTNFDDSIARFTRELPAPPAGGGPPPASQAPAVTPGKKCKKAKKRAAAAKKKCKRKK